MFLRFIGSEIDEDSGTEKGVFRLAYDLRDSGLLNKNEDVRLDELLDWFKTNLPVPKKFRSANNDSSLSLSICWFKDSAREMLDMVWQLKHILENHDILVNVLKSEDIGHVIYNDDFQVLAKPNRKAYKKIRRI